MKKWVWLSLLFVLGAQYAPTIHALVPHEDGRRDCHHDFTYSHVEKASSDAEGAPCFFCTHHDGRSGVSVQPSVIVEETLWLRTPQIPESLPDFNRFLLTPASRGPPAGL